MEYKISQAIEENYKQQIERLEEIEPQQLSFKAGDILSYQDLRDYLYCIARLKEIELYNNKNWVYYSNLDNNFKKNQITIKLPVITKDTFFDFITYEAKFEPVKDQEGLVKIKEISMNKNFKIKGAKSNEK